MGLDMYAYALAPEDVTQPTDFNVQAPSSQEIHYWRKHPNLHGWMEDLYRQKGGVELFNGTPVELTEEDIDCLQASILDGTLPETDGFFFGSSDGSETEDDLEFICKARDALADGLCVAYTSWW